MLTHNIYFLITITNLYYPTVSRVYSRIHRLCYS